MRFRIVGDDIVDLAIYTGLIEQLQRSPVVQQALSRYTDQPVNFSDINIEGLGFDPRNQGLLIGFREPVVDGKSMIVKVDNPLGLFERGETPNVSEVVLLDLQGGGIRSLTYDPVLGSFLIVNEISGHAGTSLLAVVVLVRRKRRAAGAGRAAWRSSISTTWKPSIRFIVNGEARLLMMSDDGSVKKGRPAKYMLLEYGQLSPH